MSTNENGGARHRDRLLLAALGAGESYSEAARTAGVAKATVARRMEDPAFRARVDQTRQETVDTTIGLLATASAGAVEVLMNLMNTAKSESVRLRAAQALLAMALDQRQRRLPALELEGERRRVGVLLDLALDFIPEEAHRGYLGHLQFYVQTGRLPNAAPPDAAHRPRSHAGASA